MVKLIKKFLQMKSIESFVPSGSRGNVLEWGSIYLSRLSLKSNDASDKGSFIIHFRHYFVHINSYETRSNTIDIYPVKWNLSVSNDNLTWEIISTSDDPFCSTANRVGYNSGKRYFCNVNETKQFSTKYSGYNSFVKFSLIENSFYVDDNYKDLISISGIEFNGRYISDKPKSCKTRFNERSFSLIILVLINK